MKQRRTPEKPAIVRERKLRPAPLSENAWSAFRRSLREALGGLEEDEYLILIAKGEDYFVQFAGQGDQGMQAEAVSNTFIKKSAPLSDEACQALRNLGWNPPTYVPSKGTEHPAEGSPNFYLDVRAPVPYAGLASLAVRTLRTIYHIRHPEELAYKSFSRDGVSIRFPQLKIARLIASSERSAADTSADRTEAPVATKRGNDGPQFTLPDGQPIAAEVVEADLRARITKTEETLEDAVWQLARFYSVVGRHADATACVTRLLANTADPGKQAGGYLGLGQLLEQQDRYAEAEAAYARGLEIMPATGRGGYFLHNNRGYCLNELGRHAEAEVHCRAAIALDPARHNAHKNLGLALAGQGQFVEAACCLLEADRRCPGDGRAHKHLADLLASHPEVLVEDLDLAAACRAHGLGVGPIGNA
jgi:tetratricopeptide (TPR) repeat protein